MSTRQSQSLVHKAPLCFTHNRKGWRRRRWSTRGDAKDEVLTIGVAVRLIVIDLIRSPKEGYFLISYLPLLVRASLPLPVSPSLHHPPPPVSRLGRWSSSLLYEEWQATADDRCARSLPVCDVLAVVSF